VGGKLREADGGREGGWGWNRREGENVMEKS
jgi:hypothetical protein